MTLRPVNFTAARVALHQSARSRGYKLSREGTNPRSLQRRRVCCLSEVCFLVFHDVAHASPFIVYKDRARVTFVVKR
jgi:transcriptional regulator NrdR family protein